MTQQERTEQRRQQGELTYRQRFESIGASQYFDFCGRLWDVDGHKVRIKCNACGHIFDTFNVYAVFRGKAKTFCCPECGMKSDGTVQWTKSSLCSDAMTYYLEGHTCWEVAEKFGISVVQFENERRAQGIVKTSAQRAASWKKSLTVASANGHKTQRERAREKIIERLDEQGFDLVGDKSVKCRKCGREFERSAHWLRYGNPFCPECEKDAALERKRIRSIQIKARSIAREKEKLERNPRGLSSYQLKREALLDVPHICEVCGTTYTARDRINNENFKYNIDTGCCSNVCAKKRTRRRQRENGYPKNHLQRARRYGCVYDSSVTLKKLIERDGLRCAICGELCDQNDNKWSQYFGPKSPTIDHIQPLSQGGSHTWDNVQIAHAICNSIKGDKYEAG